MKKKNIQIIVKFFWPVAAGIETNILETYSVLAKKGWDINVHTSVHSLTEKNVFKKREKIRGINIERSEFKKYLINGDIDFDKTDIVAMHNFDVLPHFLIMTKTLIRKIFGKKNYKLFLTPHGGFNPEWRIFPKHVALAKKLYHFTIGTLLINLSVDGVRAVSEWERQEIIKKGVNPKKVVTISNGLEDEAYMDIDKLASDEIKEKVQKFGRYIIQIGRVYMIKNYETTIRALTYVPSDLKYIIAGPIADESYKKSLDKLTQKLGLGGRVIFVGVIRGIDKYYLIKHAQMMVHMALWESFCNVVHEGMSQGLPIIAADNTALPLLVKNMKNGFCVATTNEKEVAEKIKFILNKNNKKLVSEIRKNNMDIALANSWTKTATNMENFYKEILKK